MAYIATHRLNEEHLRRKEINAVMIHALANVKTRRDFSFLEWLALALACTALGVVLAISV